VAGCCECGDELSGSGATELVKTVDRYQRFDRTCRLQLQAGLNMEAVCSSETLVSTLQPTRRYKPQDQHRRFSKNFLDEMYKFQLTQTVVT
jgi:hypothetical protein